MNRIETVGRKLRILKNNEVVPFDATKMLERLREQGTGLSDEHLILVIERTVTGLREKVSTNELDDLLADCAANMAAQHVDYGLLADRVAFNKFLRQIPTDFYEYLNIVEKEEHFNVDILKYAKRNRESLKEILEAEPPFDLTYFGLKTIQSGYLYQYNDRSERSFEHPKFMYLRVVLQGFYRKDDLGEIKDVLHRFCSNQVAVATPIYFSASSQPKSSQFASCFVTVVPEDSIHGMYTAVLRSALLMKNVGGVGIAVSDLRSENAPVRSYNGRASGIPRFLMVLDACCKQVTQGGGKRVGALAVYLEPWHSDVLTFLKMRRVDGSEEVKGRSIFYGLWICDEFMRRVQNNETWSLMNPDVCRGLTTVYGDEFDRLYREYEASGKYESQLPARELFTEMVKSMVEAGQPYMMFKDHVNRKSNHKHRGVIRGSNLCSEICLYFDEREVAVCTLGAVVLTCGLVEGEPPADGLMEASYLIRYWERSFDVPHELDYRALFDEHVYNSTFFATKRCRTHYYDFTKLQRNVEILVELLDGLITDNRYPLPEAELSNSKSRPIGIGVQSLANVFAELNLPFDSLEARVLNRLIFEHIYYYAVSASHKLALKLGAYETFPGSPMSQGLLQPDLWGVEPITSMILDWADLRKRVQKDGIRNSTLTALMPTASTAQIRGNNESMEPFTSNVFYRRVKCGQYVVVNKQLMNRLIKLKLWDRQLFEQMVADNGSIANIDRVPREIKSVYRTAWELPQKALLDLSIDRAPFIDQSQSLNIFMASPTMPKLSAMIMYAWRNGLKTGSYYLRTRPAFQASKTVLVCDRSKKPEKQQVEEMSAFDGPICTACSV